MIIPRILVSAWLGFRPRSGDEKSPASPQTRQENAQGLMGCSREISRVHFTGSACMAVVSLCSYAAELSSAAAKQGSHEENRRDDNRNLPE